MRPDNLIPLFASVRGLPDIGDKRARLLGVLLRSRTPADSQFQNGEARLIDLLFHLPVSVIDRRQRPALNQLKAGDTATVKITIDKHVPARKKGQPHRVCCHDDSASLDLVFFGAHSTYLKKILPPEATRYVSGQISMFKTHYQMTHPDHVTECLSDLPSIEPIYPLTTGLNRMVMRKAIHEALSRLPALPEWHDEQTLRRHEWPSMAEALRIIHNPQHPDDTAPSAPACQRLAYDEFLARQLTLIITRKKMRQYPSRIIEGNGKISSAIRAALPFHLTRSQDRALTEIAADLASPQRMIRLLQGDVGAGKTVVALLAMAMTVEAGCQAALMAPTEVLARQHFKTITSLCGSAGLDDDELTCALLTGATKAPERRRILAGLATGSIHIIVGTHALFQDDVNFSDPGLAIIDEQHRFGVHQRLALSDKGRLAANLLVMTATPIPRTLMLSSFGDMDSSRLTEKPAGRQPVDTRVIPLDRIDEVIAHMRKAMDQGACIYWICPLVEESEQTDMTPATARFTALQSLFGQRVGLVHGQMSSMEKDERLSAFMEGKINILVATTVIEVGVDAPNATIIVIEHAERFGLAQLHQLRGRVGRGTERSSCILLYKAPLGPIAASRLRILRDTDDGFRIAEEDLRLRGEGDLSGGKQSGAANLRVARPEHHGDLLEMARKDALSLLEDDPRLSGKRGKALRLLLHLFGHGGAISIADTPNPSPE